MKTPRLELLCDTNPMCYGSSTALLSILDPLRAGMGEGLHVTSLVHGVTREVLCRDPLVDETIEVDVKVPERIRERLAPLHVDAVLVVSNQTNVGVYCDLGIPIFFVDILHWYGREKTGRVWQDAERTFVQNFPGVRERASEMEPRPALTGPLLRTAPPSTRRSGTLVGLGGGRSVWVIPGENSSYATLVSDWILALSELPGPITIAGGREAVASVPPDHPIRRRASLVTLPHEAYLQQLTQSELVVTAPGLNAVFEAIYSDTPMVLLPPQNASQVAQLARYEQVGLVPPGLNLPDLDPLYPAKWEQASEREQTGFVLDALRRLQAGEPGNPVVAALRRQLRNDDARRHAVQRFREFLGPPGGEAIADAVHSWWRSLWM